MLTPPPSGSMINSKRSYPNRLRLPLLRHLLLETAMAPRKVRDQNTMAPPIITSSKITTRLGSSKMPTISPSHNPIMVPTLIRVFPQQVIQVATIMGAHLLLTAANTWWIMATANTTIAMATTTKGPRIVVCRTMAIKSQPMAWEEVTNAMITVAIIKEVTQVITTCHQDIIKLIKNPCKQAVFLAIMETVWMVAWEAATCKDKLLWFITKKPAAIRPRPRHILLCLATIIMVAGIKKMAPQWPKVEEEADTSKLTKIRDTARNTTSSHMINREEGASKITSNSHIPQASAKIKIIITMMQASTIIMNIKTTMAKSTVPHRNTKILWRKVKMARLPLKLIKMRLYKKQRTRPRLKLKTQMCKRRAHNRVKSRRNFNKRVLKTSINLSWYIL